MLLLLLMLFFGDYGTGIQKQQFGNISRDVFMFVNNNNINTVFPSKYNYIT